MCELANNVDEARHHAASNIAQLLASTPSAASAATLDASFRAISLSIRTSAMGPTDIVPFDSWLQAVDQASTILGTCAAEVWHLRSQTAGDREADGQIGKASWRERVWQDV